MDEPAHDPLVEIRSRVEMLERRLEAQEKRLDSFMTEIRGAFDRQAQEGRDQRLAILESNDGLRREVTGFRTTMDVLLAEHHRALDGYQNAANAFNRNADAMASRMKTVERVLDELHVVKQNHMTATEELRKEARRRTAERRKAQK